MRSTIDKAGRVVIPAAIRARAGLRPGMPLEVVLEGNAICLQPRIPAPKIVREGRPVRRPPDPGRQGPPRGGLRAPRRAGAGPAALLSPLFLDTTLSLAGPIDTGEASDPAQTRL